MRLHIKFMVLCCITSLFLLYFYFDHSKYENLKDYGKTLYSSLNISSVSSNDIVTTQTKTSEDLPHESTNLSPTETEKKDELLEILSKKEGRNFLNEEQKKIAEETKKLIKEAEESATPPGYVEVLKSDSGNTRQTYEKKESIKKKLKNSGERDVTFYTPKYLKQRSKKYESNSDMAKFLSEQERRREHIEKTCSKSRSHIPVRDDDIMALVAYPRMIYDRMDHLTFCPVYKSASTSWSSNLLLLRGIPKGKGGHIKNIQSVLHAVFPTLSSIVGPAFTKSTTKFMVVRHPFYRLVSCFRDKFESAKKIYYYKVYGEKMVKLYRKLPKVFTPDEGKNMLRAVRYAVVSGNTESLRKLKGNPYADPIGPTFREFVQYVINFKKSDEHWRPYYEHCATCFVQFDFILKFENLYDESKTFIEYLNRTSEIDVRWDNRPVTGVSTNEMACEYFRMLDMDTIQKLLNKYANDFLLYEYTADDFVKCASDYQPGDSMTINVPKIARSSFQLGEAVR